MDHDLHELHRTVVEMCTTVEEMIHAAVDLLTDPSHEGCTAVTEKDDVVDNYDVQIEEDCLKILALHQPVAAILRRIVAIMRISSELERVADVAVHIAKRARGLLTYPGATIPDKLEKMAAVSVNMLHKSIDAYVNTDAMMARSVSDEDDIVDTLNQEIIEGLLAQMRLCPDKIESLLQLFSTSRHIERLADHASNICEDVIYMVEGEIVRHQDRPFKLPEGA